MLQIGTNTNNRKKKQHILQKFPRNRSIDHHYHQDSLHPSDNIWTHPIPKRLRFTTPCTQIKLGARRQDGDELRGAALSPLFSAQKHLHLTARSDLSLSHQSWREKPTFLLSSKVTAARSAAQIGISTKATKGCSTKLMEWFGSEIEVEKCKKKEFTEYAELNIHPSWYSESSHWDNAVVELYWVK